ncbi:M48 family metallopeptidase [Schinkia azotoformans]|uniref:M48 family metallopeptidase n=1 Tax=Schinkia azotoformans TaxID=1454 RepID=UPI0005585F4A|nr:M48 family metallopeptidase [Schinkia azotoformans]MEC1698038.1 M48 family metallopeptidase [Schinkia azotoformans]MEC1726960.1 M48 family metallopeptidase [Schinkia azotoformans]MEC1773195.1 M48 family metallopeptidase [Schinkia azotoformans]MED4365944.1 M48 family metallopeptidase [Schinkia azotoformans]
MWLKKFLKGVFLLYGIYAAIVISYFLLIADSSNLPNGYQGSAADPTTFMNDRQLELTYEYSKIRHIIFFLLTPFDWVLFLTILAVGFSVRFRNWSESVTKISLFQKGIYVFWLSLFTFIIMFPIDYISYQLSKSYGITTSTFAIWMKDQFIDFWLDYLFMALLAFVVYALIKKYNKRWWIYAWVISVPFTVFLMFVQPVIIDPLYNDFYPLKDKELEEKILNLASKADIPAEHVYEVNMSEKTNALNAYVTGIGSNSRIVLWDTTLNELNDNEVLFVMAHEMAHYVKKHIYMGMATYLLISFIGLFIASKILEWAVKRFGQRLSIKGIKDIASLPLLLLIISMLTFIQSPISNAFSRSLEHSADEYAIEMTNDKTAAISGFQKLTIAGLSEVNPPAIVKWLRYGHPTMLERLNFLENYDVKQTN